MIGEILGATMDLANMAGDKKRTERANQQEEKMMGMQVCKHK